MVSRRLVSRSGHLLPLLSSAAICPFCALVTPARRRYQSTTTTTAETPRIELEKALVELSKRTHRVDPSRVQLALQGLRQAAGRETIRIAVVGLPSRDSKGSTVAKRVLKALLVDPLVDEQEWERRLDAHPAGEPLVVRVGETGNGTALVVSREGELRVSSPELKGLDLELLLVKAAADALQTRAHRTLVVGDGLAGAVAACALRADTGEGMVMRAVNLEGDGITAAQGGGEFVPVGVALAEEGVRMFRLGPQHAMEYERRWSASGLPTLIAWVRAGSVTQDGRTRPALRRLIAAILDGAEGERAESVDGDVGVLRVRLGEWAQRAHEELQGLDAALTEGWRRLAWWKLFWRVDDVGMIANEVLALRFLPTAEAEMVFFAGQISQLRGRDVRFAQPTTAVKTEMTSATTTTTATATELRKWPGHIAFARRYLRDETVPGLQALAQRLVMQSLATTSLGSVLAGLLYVSSASATVFEAGAVAALGAVYGLGRMQRRWEAARGFWEGEMREEGRKAVRAAEASAGEQLGGRGREQDEQGVREMVSRAREALRLLK